MVESGPPAECTRHVWLPVGDMLLAGANGTLGWVAASEDASAAGIGLLGFAALALVSGIYGFAWTSECRELEPEEELASGRGFAPGRGTVVRQRQ